MPKQRTRAQLESEIRGQTQHIEYITKQLREQEIKLKFYQAIDQHFHMLLSAICMGLKEGTVGFRVSKDLSNALPR